MHARVPRDPLDQANSNLRLALWRNKIHWRRDLWCGYSDQIEGPWLQPVLYCKAHWHWISIWKRKRRSKGWSWNLKGAQQWLRSQVYQFLPVEKKDYHCHGVLPVWRYELLDQVKKNIGIAIYRGWDIVLVHSIGSGFERYSSL